MVTSLRARDLSYTYPGGVRAVEGLDLDLGEGELVVAIGPNGAGKSTAVRLLAGLLPLQRGSVEVGGQPLAALGSRERARRIAVVPQGLQSVPDLRVEHFVMGGRYGHLGRWRQSSARDREVVRRCLAESDVAELGQRLLTQLSGGQRQRVLIARALAQEARVLLVDEPTSSLDPEHQLAIFHLLCELTRAGRTALVVTHDLNLASQFATRILVLHEGRSAATGTPEEILRREVLEGVYGDHLYFGHLPGDPGGRPRPFAVPWSRAGRGDSGPSA